MGPDLHQWINVGHGLRITNWWWLLWFMDIGNWCYPIDDLLRILLCVLNWMNFIIFASSILLVLISYLEVSFSLIWLVQSWLILYYHKFTKTCSPNIYGCPSGLGIFKKASTSPIAGIYSGTKAFNLVSSSCKVGVYLYEMYFTFVWIWIAIWVQHWLANSCIAKVHMLLRLLAAVDYHNYFGSSW